MSMNILNDISAVYREQIAESAVPGKPAERLGAVTAIPKSEQEAAAERIRVKTEEKRKTQKPNDGNLANNYPPYNSVTYGDIVAGRRGEDEMGGKKKTSKGMKEGFSNWRQDLSEVMDNIKDNTQIKEKEINNKVKTSAMGGGLKLGEAVEQLGGELIEMVEVELTEEVNIATEYFYEQGLNEHGIDLLIEDLGIEEFVDFVNEIVEEYTLVEARTLTGKKKNPQKLPKGTSPTTLTKAAVKKYGTTRKLTSSPSSSTIKKNRVAVKKAVVKQPETKSTSSQTKTGIAGRIGAALGAVVKKGREDIKRVQDAAQTARNVATRRGAEAKAVYDAVRERGKKAEQSPTATRARRKATVAAGRAAQAAAPVVKKAVKAGAAAAGAGAGSLKAGNSPAAAAGRAAGTFVRKMTKEELELQEKSESEQQQKLFGLALSVKRGDTPRSEVSDAVLKIVDSMSEKKIRDFAKTKHEGIPKKVEESVDEIPMTPQELNLQRRKSAIDVMIARKRQQAMRQQQQQEEFVSEEDYDRIKDERMMRGGVDGNTNYRKPPKTTSAKPVDPEHRKKIAQKALDLVRQQTISKYGKGSLM
jgi:hypothetical protein